MASNFDRMTNTPYETILQMEYFWETFVVQYS